MSQTIVTVNCYKAVTLLRSRTTVLKIKFT